MQTFQLVLSHIIRDEDEDFNLQEDFLAQVPVSNCHPNLSPPRPWRLSTEWGTASEARNTKVHEQREHKREKTARYRKQRGQPARQTGSLSLGTPPSYIEGCHRDAKDFGKQVSREENGGARKDEPTISGPSTAARMAKRGGERKRSATKPALRKGMHVCTVFTAAIIITIK
jgi:hypothetical protein